MSGADQELIPCVPSQVFQRCCGAWTGPCQASYQWAVMSGNSATPVTTVIVRGCCSGFMHVLQLQGYVITGMFMCRPPRVEILQEAAVASCVA